VSFFIKSYFRCNFK